MRTHRFIATAGASCAIALALAGGTNASAAPASPSGLDCSPNYGGCVPMASDVDCAGGEGDGPEYVEGPVDVIGADIYGLDDNDDGVGCGDRVGGGGGSGGGGGAAGDSGGATEGAGAGDLAATGSTSGVLVAGATAALAAGGLALVVSRRRAV